MNAHFLSFLLLLSLLFSKGESLIAQTVPSSSNPIKIAVFQADVSPPIGSPVAYAPARKIVDPLSARGIILLSDQKPVVLCAVDWIGIANEGLEFWRKKLAKAAGTSMDRVTVHALHQHDGVRCDFSTEKNLKTYGLGGQFYDLRFLKKTVKKVAKAVRRAKKKAQLVTHIGFGKAKVNRVASNRRILGADGKVEIIRWSKTKDPAAIAAPEGLIDPWLKSVSFWNGQQALAVLTYYAVHPQSYYGQGDVTSDFVGLARNAREQALNGLPHIHFNGAGGNITAGKYNDGSVARRPILAQRMEKAMEEAWSNIQKTPISSKDLDWKSKGVSLPLGNHLIEKELKAKLAYPKLDIKKKLVAGKQLSWLQRTKAGKKINITTLQLGNTYLLHLPGELFIEYQLNAQKLRSDLNICTAAYGEYGTGYIGTEIGYSQGGYETSERASFVSPEVEGVLMEAIRELLSL